MNQPPWLATLPKDWRAQRLRHIAEISNSNVDKKSYEDGHSVRLCNYTDVYYNDFITDDMDLMRATATGQEIRRFRLLPGDVVITKDSESWDDIAIPACVAEKLTNVVCGYHLSLFRPVAGRLDGRFLLRALQAQGVREQFWTAANGVTRFGLGQQGMKDALLPVPPLPAQKAIADFLDRKTAAIDALIEKKQKLLDLLAEKRAALINQAVTKGLDPDVPMKDSGIPWIGEIPAHWEVRPSRFLVDESRPIMYGIVLPGPHVEGGVPVVKANNCRPGRLDPAMMKRTTREIESRYARSRLRAGDVVIAIRGSVGSAEIVPATLAGANLTQDAARLAPSRKLTSPWLHLLTQSKWFTEFITPRITGATVKGINIWDLSRVPIPDVPVQEQERISQAVNGKLQALDGGPLSRSIECLQEYRQALITAAVTGQLDIGEEAPA